ncbi:MAG: tetratricopeptide repeat protein [Leptolyngbyaceae cyanobacterium CSU_1_4]|nr:tetratricopeptide repeat protein [Leptolyngbyaceae cyanobacterium CSU_1_4]
MEQTREHHHFSKSEQPQQPQADSQRWLWILLLVGLPLTSATVWLTQSDLPARFERFQHQAFSTLKPPYRYSYDLSDYRNPASLREREIGFYQDKIRKNPQGGLDRAYLASTYLGMARTTGEGSWYLLAEQTAKESLARLSVDNPSAISTLARVAEARHDFAVALRLTQQITDERDVLSIKTTSNLATGNLSEASQAADQLVDLSLNTHAFLLQALVRNAQGKEQALESFNYALEVEEAGEISTSARVRTLLGRFYYERGQLKMARDLYEEALTILPEYPLALINLAQLEIRQGRYEAALRRYDQISSGVPTVYNPLILRGKARVRGLQGDRQAAATLWAQSETLLRQSFVGAGDFGHRRDLARLLLERGRAEDLPEAVSLMRAEIKNRRDAETLDIYAWALMQTGQPLQAQTAIQKAIASGTRNPGILDRAREIEQALGNSPKANEYRQQVIKSDPQFNEQARQAIGLNAGLGG